MTHKKNSPKISALLLIACVGGCATTTTVSPTIQVKATTKSSPHRFTQSVVTDKPFTAIATAGEKESAAANSASTLASVEKSSKIQIYPGTGVLVKAPTLGPAKPASTDTLMLNFESADLREVVKAIVGDILNETYIIDPRVQGLISLHTSTPIARTAVLPTLETLLRMNGAAIIKEENIYKVVPAATAARGSITPQLGGSSTPLPGGYSVQIVPLKFISSKEMVKILEPFISDATAIRIDEMRNLVILAGTERELKHLQETIDMFDVDWLSGMSVGLFTLQNVDVKTAAADLDKIFGDKNQSPLGGLVKLVPIERLNAMLVITPQPKYVEQAKIWIERMDRSGGAGGGTRLFVYPVQNGKAEKLAGLLSDVFGKPKSQKVVPTAALAPGLTPVTTVSTPATTETRVSTPTPATPPVLTQLSESAGDSVAVSGDVRVIADKDNNTLLVMASPSDYEKIESAIRKLDIPARQVLIDVIIANVLLKDDLSYGVQWWFANQATQAKGAPPLGQGGVLAGGGFSYAWNSAAAVAQINALQTDSRTTIISRPHLMVVDNQPAKMQVGVKVNVQTGVASGVTTGVVNSYAYLDTGISLSVTPHINAGGMVTLEIAQDSSETSPGGNGTNPNITNRSITSTVIIKSGESMVLGGLIQEEKTKNKNGFPILSQIPLLGALFGAQSDNTKRTELVMFITPRVVENTHQSREITDEFRKKLTGLGELLESAGKFSGVEKPQEAAK